MSIDNFSTNRMAAINVATVILEGITEESWPHIDENLAIQASLPLV